MRHQLVAILLIRTCLSWICLNSITFQAVSAHEAAKRLYNYLFYHKSYNSLIRPAINISDPVRVNLGVALVQIINLEEKKQIMKSNVWLRFLWKDERLMWTPKDFDNITVFHVDADRVWRPGIVLFNNADGHYEASWRPNVLIHSNGELLWIPPALYKSSCTLDVTYFPKDIQRCSIRLGSWTYNAREVVLDWYAKQTHVDLNNYVASGTWDIVDCQADIVINGISTMNTSNNHHQRLSPTGMHQSVGEEFTYMTYTIVLRRKALFYMVLLICPCAMIAALNVCLFYVPANAGKKTTLSVSLILAVVVFLLLLRKMLPPTSESVPLISKYLLFTFMMNVVSLFTTVGVINCHFRSSLTHRMGPWVRWVLIRALAPMLNMQVTRSYSALKITSIILSSMNLTQVPLLLKQRHSRLHKKRTEQKAANQETPHSQSVTNRLLRGNNSPESLVLRLPVIKRALKFQAAVDHVFQSEQCSLKRYPIRGNNSSQTIVKRTTVFDKVYYRQSALTVARMVNTILLHLHRRDAHQQILMEWKLLAAVMDRLQLWIFLFVTFGCTSYFFFCAPTDYSHVDQTEVIRALMTANTNNSS